MTDTTTTPPQDEAASHEAPAEHKGFSFADMHLAVGDRLQIECPAGTGLGRAFVRVIGYVDHLSILVTAPVAGNRRIDLVENDLVVVRVFSRENAFAFRASVLRACRLPFHYVHLSFPEIIQGSVIRKATRVRTELPVSVSVEQPGADATPGTGGDYLSLAARSRELASNDWAETPLMRRGSALDRNTELLLPAPFDLETITDAALEAQHLVARSRILTHEQGMS